MNKKIRDLAERGIHLKPFTIRYAVRIYIFVISMKIEKRQLKQGEGKKHPFLKTYTISNQLYDERNVFHYYPVQGKPKPGQLEASQ